MAEGDMLERSVMHPIKLMHKEPEKDKQIRQEKLNRSVHLRPEKTKKLSVEGYSGVNPKQRTATKKLHFTLKDLPEDISEHQKSFDKNTNMNSDQHRNTSRRDYYKRLDRTIPRVPSAPCAVSVSVNDNTSNENSSDCPDDPEINDASATDDQQGGSNPGCASHSPSANNENDGNRNKWLLCASGAVAVGLVGLYKYQS